MLPNLFGSWSIITSEINIARFRPRSSLDVTIQLKSVLRCFSTKSSGLAPTVFSVFKPEYSREINQMVPRRTRRVDKSKAIAALSSSARLSLELAVASNSFLKFGSSGFIVQYLLYVRVNVMPMHKSCALNEIRQLNFSSQWIWLNFISNSLDSNQNQNFV